MTTAAMAREANVDHAAPATPMEHPKIRIALPMTFITFIPTDTYMGSLELPMERNIAAQELNTARNG